MRFAAKGIPHFGYLHHSQIEMLQLSKPCYMEKTTNELGLYFVEELILLAALCV